MPRERRVTCVTGTAGRFEDVRPLGHPWGMVALVVGMLLCVGLALAVVALVAIPARRQGRELLTPRGEEVIASARERTAEAIVATGEAIAATKDKVAEAVTSSGDEPQAPPATGATSTPARPAAPQPGAAPAPGQPTEAPRTRRAS
jgi:hypothetical protein